MKWYKPIESVKTDIKEPMQKIAVLAVMAIAIAALALFVAIGKD